MCNLRFFVLAIFLFGGLAKALAQSPLILDVESDMETDPLIWVSYGLEYHSGLDMIPEPGICRSEAEPPVNANTGYWIRCVGAPGIFMIGIYLYNTGISESPKYLAVSAYFPPGIENQLRMSYGGESDIYLDVDNDWKLTIIDVQDYAIHPESTIAIFVEGAGVIIDKIMVLYEDISTSTTELTTTESETTTEEETPEQLSTTEDLEETTSEPPSSTDAAERTTEPPSTTKDTGDTTEPHTTTDDTAETEPHSSTPATPSTGEPEPTTPAFCPPTGVHTFPYPGNCTLYIKCFDGLEQILSCAPLMFDKVDLVCKPEGEAMCDEDPPNNCPPEGYEAIPHPTNCSQYYECFNGNLYNEVCAPNTYFDATPEVLHCNRAEIALCHAECGEAGIEFHAIRSADCKWYKVCLNGVSANLECGAGTVFNPEQSGCVDSDEYTCPYNNTL